ncbi:MAG: hypothetical protein FJW30_06970 [Acidobacteria bacterium]|nr:hypothetical protein [Acidobacteriota bacterium]
MRLAPWLLTLSLSAEPARVFERVWETIRSNYFDPKLNGLDWPAGRERFALEAAASKSDEALYAVLNRMLAKLKDRHTAAIPPAQVDQRRRRSANRLGFGLQLVEGHWVVKSVDPQSDFFSAGITRGWILEKMAGQTLPPTLREMGEFDTRTGYREKCDTGALFEMYLRDVDDSSRSVRMRCKPIAISPLHEARLLEGGILYIRFDEFAPATHKWFAGQLRTPASAMVLDLRENSGGLLDTLQDILPYFYRGRFPFGEMKTRSGREWKKSLTGRGRHAFTGPVAVLIDTNTASASEILAAVLQESGRARVYGRRSSGVVLFSVRDALPGGGELQYSVWDYETPKAKRLEGVGVTPDVVVEPALTDLRRRRDPILEAAILDLKTQR